MIYPTFIEFFDSMPKCNRELHTANTVHLKPYSDEVYSFVLPFRGAIERCVLLDSKGIEHTIANVSVVRIIDMAFLNISNIMFDDWNLARLKIYTAVTGGAYYSTFIRVSSNDIDETTYIKYRDNGWQFFGGIRLNLSYWHKKPFNENTAYYQVTREQSISVGSKRDHRERYYLNNVSIGAATALCDILTYPIVYFNGIRTSCPELPEIPDLQACENFISTDVWVSKNYDDKDENNIDLSVYVIGNRQLNEIIGDGNNNIINSNINV